MKKLLIMAVLLMAAMNLKAQEGEIIYTEFDPPLYFEVKDIGGISENVLLDIDQDGGTDYKLTYLFSKSTYYIVQEGWNTTKFRTVGFDGGSDTIPWSNGSESGWTNWEVLHCWNGAEEYYDRIGISKTIDGKKYYGWIHQYGSEEHEFPFKKWVYIDKMAFCTIPDYPLRWGQTSLYSIGMDSAEWYYEILNDDGSITYQHLECVGDTLIGREGKRPKVIVRSNTHYDRDGQTEVTHEYIYEENGIVYWWNKDLQEFTTLYNLNANAGDAWEIKVGTESLTMHVDAVENIEYEGHTYRILHVSDSADVFGGNIVCNIGHLTSFFPERLMTRGRGYRVEGMRCYWVDGELVYKTGDEDCDAIYEELHHGIEESTDDAVFAVYPNPTAGVLFVETRHGTSLPNQNEYRISNPLGQTLIQGQITNETQQINIEKLPAGMYFITLANETRKFVVQ